MAHVKLDLSVRDRTKFQQTLDEARTHGLEVSRSYVHLGMISGTIEATAIDGLVRIDGIESVSPKAQAAAIPVATRTAAIIPLRKR